MNFKRRIIIALFIVSIVFIFSETVYAYGIYSGGFSQIKVYYYEKSRVQESQLIFACDTIDVYGNFSSAEKAFMIYNILFENYDKEKIGFVPSGTKLLGVFLEDGHLIINVSEEICGYGGGNAYERALIKTIMRNAVEIEGVSYVSLRIENKLTCLPEGSWINKERLR